MEVDSQSILANHVTSRNFPLEERDFDVGTDLDFGLRLSALHLANSNAKPETRNIILPEGLLGSQVLIGLAQCSCDKRSGTTHTTHMLDEHVRRSEYV